jgi:hypothetical protein
MAGSTRWGRTPLATVVGLLLTASALAANSSAEASARPSGKLVPASGALFGAHVDPDGVWSGNAVQQSEVTSFEGAIGRKIAIDQHYYSWTNTFPSRLEQWDVAGTDTAGVLEGSRAEPGVERNRRRDDPGTGTGPEVAGCSRLPSVVLGDERQLGDMRRVSQQRSGDHERPGKVRGSVATHPRHLPAGRCHQRGVGVVLERP